MSIKLKLVTLAFLPMVWLAGSAAIGPVAATEDSAADMMGQEIAEMPGQPAGDRCARMAERINQRDKKLTPEQVRDVVAGRLAEFGEGTLKVGKVTAKEPGVVAVNIVTTAGSSLVITREVSTKTGGPADFEKRCEDREGRRAQASGPGDMPPARMHRGRLGGTMHGPGGGGPAGDPMHARFDGPMGEHMRGPMGGPREGLLGGLETAMLVGPGPGHDLNLTADQAKRLTDAAVILLGNPRLKAGAAKKKDANTITVDIVTVDNALVLRREVDRHTGRVHKAE